MADQNPRNELKHFAFQLWGTQFLQCLEPTEECTDRSIGAHSVQNQRILDVLQEDGHVVMPFLHLLARAATAGLHVLLYLSNHVAEMFHDRVGLFSVTAFLDGKEELFV